VLDGRCSAHASDRGRARRAPTGSEIARRHVVQRSGGGAVARPARVIARAFCTTRTATTSSAMSTSRTCGAACARSHRGVM
jgi:hypothetical protein